MRFDPSAHKVVDALLPWYVNRTLEGDELEYVRAHLEECAQCRQEAAWLRELHAACVTAGSVPGASNPLYKLRRQLETRSTKHTFVRRLAGTWQTSNAWARWGAVAASFVLGAAVILATSGPREAVDPAPYRTLGAVTTADASGSLIVVFDPATTEAELRRILREAGARLVDGPTQANAYVLDVPAGQHGHAMQVLRKEHAVVLVERLGPENAP